MIQLTWDPAIAAAIAISGFFAGFVLGPLSWPIRAAEHVRPPVGLALAMGLSIGAMFFVPLGVFRIATGHVAELQATVLYLVFILTGSAGLWLRVRL